jgi:hypothetical protein
MMPVMVYGFRILTNPLLCKRVILHMCRSKKRRIIKKWRKNPKNYINLPDDNIYRLPGNILIMHPKMKYRVMEAMKLL